MMLCAGVLRTPAGFLRLLFEPPLTQELSVNGGNLFQRQPQVLIVSEPSPNRGYQRRRDGQLFGSAARKADGQVEGLMSFTLRTTTAGLAAANRAFQKRATNDLLQGREVLGHPSSFEEKRLSRVHLTHIRM